MREYFSNAGKKEQRQFNQLLDKAVKQRKTGKVTDVEARTVPKTHRLKKRPGKSGTTDRKTIRAWRSTNDRQALFS